MPMPGTLAWASSPRSATNEDRPVRRSSRGGRGFACGDTRDWKALRRLLSTHSPVTTVLPLKDVRVLRIRKPSLPDPEQALIYQNLGIHWKTAFPPIKSFANP
jgi:hypothetical protein